ncbi:hypothetical protein D3C87_1595850 [compost metagenome]
MIKLFEIKTSRFGCFGGLEAFIDVFILVKTKFPSGCRHELPEPARSRVGNNRRVQPRLDHRKVFQFGRQSMFRQCFFKKWEIERHALHHGLREFCFFVDKILYEFVRRLVVGERNRFFKLCKPFFQKPLRHSGIGSDFFHFRERRHQIIFILSNSLNCILPGCQTLLWNHRPNGRIPKPCTHGSEPQYSFRNPH